MILETDFVDHWKTQRLVFVCGAEAVLCLLRIWSYCQQRKRWQFDNAQASIIEWIGKWNGEKGLLLSTLKEVGFIDEEEDGEFSMHDFDTMNSRMIANWKNGTGKSKKKNPLKKKSTQRTSNGILGLGQTEANATPRIGHGEANGIHGYSQTEANGTPNKGNCIHGYSQTEANGTPNKGNCILGYSQTEANATPNKENCILGLGQTEANGTPNKENCILGLGQTEANGTPNKENCILGYSQTEANGTPSIPQSKIEEKQEEGKKESTKEKKKEEKKEEIYTPLLSPQWGKVQVEVFNAFCEMIDSDENIAEEDRLALASKFAEFISYRRKIKPFKTENSGAHHARLACACMRDGLSAADIAALMQTAMDNEWQRWNIDSEIAKLKRGIREKSNTPPPQTDLDPSTFGIPQGALNY